MDIDPNTRIAADGRRYAADGGGHPTGPTDSSLYHRGPVEVLGAPSDGDAPVWDGTAEEWRPGAAGAGGGSPFLEVVAHAAPGGAVVPVAATNAVGDVDAANLVITFTVPASGAVLVEQNALVSVGAGTSGAWGLADGGVAVTETQVVYDSQQVRAQVRHHVAGLTPDDVLTWTWTHHRTFGAGAFNFLSGGEAGAAILTVAAAP